MFMSWLLKKRILRVRSMKGDACSQGQLAWGSTFLPSFPRAKEDYHGTPIIYQVPGSHLLPGFVLLLILMYLGRTLVQSE